MELVKASLSLGNSSATTVVLRGSQGVVYDILMVRYTPIIQVVMGTSDDFTMALSAAAQDQVDAAFSLASFAAEFIGHDAVFAILSRVGITQPYGEVIVFPEPHTVPFLAFKVASVTTNTNLYVVEVYFNRRRASRNEMAYATFKAGGTARTNPE